MVAEIACQKWERTNKSVRLQGWSILVATVGRRLNFYEECWSLGLRNVWTMGIFMFVTRMYKLQLKGGVEEE